MSETPPQRPRERWLRYGFSIAGTQKSGTSSLSAMLDQHPQIRRAPRKELHYFDDEQVDWNDHADHSEYRVIALPGHRITGDATPSYLWWPNAMERMREYNPDMKVIALFRDPIERLFSQWLMNVNRWPRATPPWSTFITELAPDGLLDEVPADMPGGTFRLHSGLVRGYYGQQLERAIALFGSAQVRALEFRAFLRDYTGVLDELTDFLDLAPYQEHPPLPHSMKGKPAEVAAGPVGEDIAWLLERYRADFERFKEVSGLDVSDWPIQRMVDGDLDPDQLAADYRAKLVITPAEA